MMTKMVGFDWPEGKSKHVCYFTPNGNIGELSVGVGGSWQIAALMALAKAPLAAEGDIAGYAWPTSGSLQVAYFTADNHIHEIHRTVSSGFKHADLTVATGAPPAAERRMTAYAWGPGGTKQVAYKGPGGHIHELWVAAGKVWKHADLTASIGAPPCGPGPIAGYSWGALGTKQLVYKDAAGHIHELFVGVGGGWQHADLTNIASAPAATGGFLTGYAFEPGKSKHVVYTTADGHIHELSVKPSAAWKHAILTATAGAPTTVGSGTSVAAYAWPAAGTKQVAYNGSGGGVHELYAGVDGSWAHADLTRIAGGPESDVSGYFTGYAWGAGKSKQVAYTTADGHIHELYVRSGGQWKHAVLPGQTH